MKNIIEYYYNIYIDSVRKIKNDYYFKYNNNLYMFYFLEYVPKIDDMVLKTTEVNRNFHQIVLNKNRNIITYDGQNNYILMKINIKKNSIITILDIIEFQKNNVFIENKKNLWIDLWGKKIDYLEYYINSKESLDEEIKSCINYYIGLSENSLQYLKLYFANEKKISYVHRRVESTYTLYDLYNPINIILDYPERNIAEYIKSLFYNDNINTKKIEMIFDKTKELNLNYELVFARLLFPTYLLDIFDLVETNKVNKEKIIFAYDKTLEFEKILIIIYEQIKRIKKIPVILWLKR